LRDNAFCRILFVNNEAAFKDFLYYILTLEALADKRVLELRTFEAFSSIICGAICTQRTPSCLPSGNQPSCYDAFLRQNGEELSLKMKSAIYEKYAGVTPALIGVDYDLNDLPYLQYRLKSKKRKSIRRKIKAAIKKVKKGIAQSCVKEESAHKAPQNIEVTTTCFYNDNAEWTNWKGELERIFSDEDNN